MIAFEETKVYFYSLSPDHMKTTILLLVLSACLTVSCTKSKEDVVSDEHSFVYTIRFTCGPTCDGQAWMIKTAYGDFEVINLPSPYQESELPVKVAFQRTGRTAEPGQGTGVELVNLVSITRR